MTLLVGLLGAFLAPASARATEFLVNATTADIQQNASATALAGGGFVITWEDNSQTNGDTNGKAIRARRYDAAGMAQGSEFLVNTITQSDQKTPSVAALIDGGFVIAWEDDSQTNSDSSFADIRAQRYDAAGVAQGSEFLVNTIRFFHQTRPSVAALSGGGFVISWTDNSDDAGGGDAIGFAVRAQRYDAAGLALGNEFLVNTTTAGNQSNSSVAGLSGGGFVISWQDSSADAGGGDTSGSAIRARRYDAAGLAQGAEFLVNTTTAGGQVNSSAAGLSGGGFVISWEDSGQTNGDTSGSAIRAQRYDAAGVAQGAEFLVNTTTADTQEVPSAAALTSGGFVIAWQDFGQTGDDTSGFAVRSQRYDAAGVAQSGEFLVNTTTANNQRRPSVAGLTGGGYVIAWDDNSLTSSNAIRVDRFSAPTGPITVLSSVLPAARSGFLPGGPAITVFASAINAGGSGASNCMVSLPGGSPVNLGYQQTDAANVPIGAADLPFDLASGQTRSFILAFTPAAVSTGMDLFPKVLCDNTSVDAIPGVNTVFLSIDDHAVPDILSISATPSGDGIVNVPSGSANFMTAAATNFGVGDAAGSSDATVSVSVDTGAASLPVLLQFCETDAASVCLPSSPLGPGPVSTTIGAGASFFTVFVTDQSANGIPLDAAKARVFLRFTDASGMVRSVTSAAVTANAPADAPVMVSSLPRGAER